MAILSDYTAGTISVAANGTVVTGTGTGWETAGFAEGDTLWANGYANIVLSVDSETQITLYFPWQGGALAGASYRLRFEPDGSRISAQARQLIDLLLGNGNLEAFAGLTGLPDRIPIFTGPGTMSLVPKTDLISGINTNVTVDTLPERAAYDSEAEGYTVLVADIGDGRAAVYAKLSASSADWSDPAYLTGPKGDTGSPWDDWRGPWQTGTAYIELAGVEHGGSSYICTTAHTSDAASEPGVGASWQTYWDLVAAKGLDGDIVGPASATDNNVVLFDGTTGKLIKDGGALGSAAFAASGDFATAAQGVKADAAIPRADAGILSGFRNKIINGDFEIWQRSMAGTLKVGYPSADRWLTVFANAVAAGTFSAVGFSDGQTDVPGDPTFFGRIETTNVAGVAAFQLQQRIENVRKLSNKKITVTFWAKADSARSVPIIIRQDFGVGGSSSVDHAIGTASLTTNWQKFSFVFDVPSVVGKTIDTPSSNLALIFVLPISASLVFDIAHVSLVEGDATAEDDPFSPRHIQQELALCQRYGRSVLLGLCTSYDGAWANRHPMPPMRGTPTLVINTSGGTGASWVWINGSLAQDGLHSQNTESSIFLDAEL